MAGSKKTPFTPEDLQALPTSLRESAQQIWMAGLSAFAKAQNGGNKVFEALMKEGEAIQSRTRKAARDQVDDMAHKASGTWDKIEQVFEDRVAGALHKLGVPTHDDIETLSRRVAQLSAMVDALQAATKKPTRAAAKTPARTASAGKTASAKKTAARKTSARKTQATKTSATKTSTAKTRARKTSSRKAAD